MLKRFGAATTDSRIIQTPAGPVVLPDWALRLCAKLHPTVVPGESARWWGGAPLDPSLDELFFCIAGATGSGKSSVLAGLLATIIPTITPGSDRRLFISDPKNTLLNAVYGMAPQVPVRVLTASDLRSLRIPFGKIVTSLARSKQLARNLVPIDPGETAPFFPRAVRRIASGAMESLLTTIGTDWELRDLLLILDSEDYILQILDRIPQTRSRLRYMARPDLWDDIQASIEDKLDEMKILAAWWHRARGEFVPSEWLQGESIVFLGGDPQIEEVMSIIRRLLAKILSEDILAQTPSSSRRTFLCIDEFQAYGGDDQPTPGMHKLATEGRDRGAVLILTFQHVNDLIHLYKQRAMSLIGQFGNFALLKANDHEMAEWESKMLGGYRRIEWKVSYSEGRSIGFKRGSSRNWSVSRTPEVIERSLVPLGEFLQMPKASSRHGIHGYFRSAALGTWRPHIGPDFVSEFLPKPNPFVVGYDPRPSEHQYLEPFGEPDFARLKLEPEDPSVAEKRGRRLERARERLQVRKRKAK